MRMLFCVPQDLHANGLSSCWNKILQMCGTKKLFVLSDPSIIRCGHACGLELFSNAMTNHLNLDHGHYDYGKEHANMQQKNTHTHTYTYPMFYSNASILIRTKSPRLFPVSFAFFSRTQLFNVFIKIEVSPDLRRSVRVFVKRIHSWFHIVVRILIKLFGFS